jgi:hypothetical protein
MSDGNRDLERLAARERLVAMNAAVPPGSDIKPDRVLIMNHYPCRAEVGPAFLRIVGDVDATRADISAAVQFEPARCREGQDVHVFAALNIFQHRPVAHHTRRNMFQILRAPAPLRDEFHRAQILRHAQAQAEPLGRAERVDKNAITLRITLYRIEQHRRGATAFVDDIRNAADL